MTTDQAIILAGSLILLGLWTIAASIDGLKDYLKQRDDKERIKNIGK